MADIYELTTRSALNLRFALRHAGSSRSRAPRHSPTAEAAREHTGKEGGRTEEPRERSRAVRAATERPSADALRSWLLWQVLATTFVQSFQAPSLVAPAAPARANMQMALECATPTALLAASSSPLTPYLPPAGSCLARGRRLAARPGTRWASPTCARMAAPSTSGCARRRCEQQLPCIPRSRSAHALRLRARPDRSSTGGCAWRRRLASSSRSPDSTSAATCPRRLLRSHSSR